MDSLFILGALLSSGLALLTLLGTLELLFLTVSGALPARRAQPSTSPQPLQHLAVVIPAHNEAADIAACVNSLQACEKPTCPLSLVVVADNCSDDTAAQAAAAGARVLVRQHDTLRGKGYALDHAFNQLLAEGVDAVLIVDADTAAATDFLTACETAFIDGAAALQCRYTVKNPDDSLRTRLMHVALLAFNVLRPRGREYWRQWLWLTCHNLASRALYRTFRGRRFGISSSVSESRLSGYIRGQDHRASRYANRRQGRRFTARTLGRRALADDSGTCPAVSPCRITGTSAIT